MLTEKRAIRLIRVAALAIPLIVPTISTPITAAYADNETAAAIEPPYQTAGDGRLRSTFCAPAASMKSEFLAATGRKDEVARKIHRPGVSDR